LGLEFAGDERNSFSSSRHFIYSILRF
jgi:hypothetical protein